MGEVSSLDWSVLVIHLDQTKWHYFLPSLCAMILAMCLAACLIEQLSINLLNIYINNENGNNNNNDDGIIVQKCNLLHVLICCFVKANNAFLQETVL